MAKVKTPQEIELENRVTIPMYFNKNILPLKKTFHAIDEANVTSICPFHHETDPSWHYWSKNKMFHCFGCGVSGNVIKLHQLVRKQYYGEYISYNEAINQLITMYGLHGVIESVQNEVELPKSVFDKVRSQMLEGLEHRSSPSTLTYTTFSQQNKRILESDSPLDVKLNEFTTLDMLAGLVIREDVLN